MLQHLGGYHKKVMNVVVDEHVEDIMAEPVENVEAEVDVDPFLDGIAGEKYFEDGMKAEMIDMDLD